MENNKELQEMLATAIPYIQTLISGFEKIKIAASEKDFDVLSTMPEAVEGAMWMKKLVENFDSNYADNSELESAIDDINEALSNEDFNVVSDAIEYAIIPILEEYYKVLSNK